MDGKGCTFVPHCCILRCESVSLLCCHGFGNELEENQLSDVSSGNKTELQDEKEFVQNSICRKV